jgi:hypothetical protein
MVLSSNRRKKLLRALAVIAWLLLLGFISYCLFLPDLEEVSRQLRAIREDPNLTLQQRFEQSREIYSKLTPGQGRQVFQNDLKKMHYERNAEMQKFLKMSPEEQVAYLKKQAEERKQFEKKGGFVVKVPGDGGGGVAAVKSVGGGPGGGAIFFGPPGGGNVNVRSGGPPNPSQMQKSMLDNLSPETRAGQSYQKGLSR